MTCFSSKKDVTSFSFLDSWVGHFGDQMINLENNESVIPSWSHTSRGWKSKHVKDFLQYFQPGTFFHIYLVFKWQQERYIFETGSVSAAVGFWLLMLPCWKTLHRANTWHDPQHDSLLRKHILVSSKPSNHDEIHLTQWIMHSFGSNQCQWLLEQWKDKTRWF